MTDAAHVQTKIRQSLSESKDLSVVLITNPTSDPISNYRTAIDPALIAIKPNRVDQRVCDLNDEPIPAWLSTYGTGLNPTEIWHKANISPGGIQQVIVGDGPWVHDLGPVVDLPTQNQNDLSDDWHKNVVTDLANTDVVIIASALLSWPYGRCDYLSQAILFPVSSRHIVKTTDGTLHAVCQYTISSLSRIVYLKSTNGGETWTSSIVDNDDGHHYFMPSITCDKDNGIHITYTRWSNFDHYTYWLFCGSSTPSGFELYSGVGGNAYHTLLGATDGTIAKVYNNGGDPDAGNVHTHGGSFTQDVGTAGVSRRDPTGSGPIVPVGHGHTSSSAANVSATRLPSSRSLKFLRYPGMPVSLPADIIVPFDTTVPTGFTRYSDQDDYAIYLSSDVGSTVGSSNHRHQLTSYLTGVTSHSHLGDSGSIWACETHYHDSAGTTALYSDYQNNDWPSYGIILGKLTSAATTLPQHALLLMNTAPSLSNFTVLSGAASSIADHVFKGKTTYSDLGGNTSHDHADVNSTSDAAAGSVYGMISVTPYTMSAASNSHTHGIHFAFNSCSNEICRFLPVIVHNDASRDISTFGCDLFYRYISPAGVSSSPVNISQLNQFFPSHEGICLVDNSNNVHFLWSGQGLNTTPTRARICYNKQTSGVLGTRTDLTTSDNHMVSPSMDIDNQANIHAAWCNETTNQSIQYKKYSSGAWGSMEEIDTTQYCDYPSNIVTDKDCNVYLFYQRFSDPAARVSDLYYSKRTTTWAAAVCITPNKASAGYDQYTGQAYIDNKGNVVFIWSGKGYGSHTTKYHPVYRYIKPDGTIVPATTSDPVDIFPYDDTEIFCAHVFWHSYPLSDSVYQNLVVDGLSILYLYDPRNTADKDTADICFYSSPRALVGDVGNSGSGGSGDSEFTPGGVGAESILQKETYTITTKGKICLNHISQELNRSSIS